MFSIENICGNCFNPTMRNGLCSKCHWSLEQENKFRLPEFAILKNNYIVGRTLGAGGFGITYKALDMGKNTICAIKEYAPVRLSFRSISGDTLTPDGISVKEFIEGRTRFCSEAKTLFKLNHIPAVVQIYDFFFENNTAYFVMEYLQGLTLKTFAKNLGGKLPLDIAMKKINMVGKALSAVHKMGVFHRDISPDNIILTSLGAVKLIDFGSAKQMSTDSDDSLSVLLKPGFAPPEQYSKKGHQGAWTDVYALASTLYSITAGEKIPDALDRTIGKKYRPLYEVIGCPKKISDAVDRALTLQWNLRTRSVDEFLFNITTSNADQSALEPVKKPALASNARSNSSSLTLIAFHKGKRCGIWNLPANADIAVGRAPSDSKILLNSNQHKISRRHCIIRHDTKENAVFLTDYSTLGTYVGKMKLEKGKKYRISADAKINLPEGYTLGFVKK